MLTYGIYLTLILVYIERIDEINIPSFTIVQLTGAKCGAEVT